MINLSISTKISGFVIPSTIAFGVVMTCLSLYFLNNINQATIRDFKEAIVELQHFDNTHNYPTNLDAALTNISKKSDGKIRHIGIILISIVRAVIIMATIGAIVISVLIGKPVQKVSTGLENISSGDADLTQRLLVSANDETGKVSRFFNLFLEKLHYIFKNLQTSAE